MPAPGLFEEWHDYFLLNGTAAATLLGLLFVALSFNLDVVLHESRTYLVSIARQAFLGFVFVLFISLGFLIPHATLRVQGMQVAVLGIFLAGMGGRGLVALRAHRLAAGTGRFPVLRNVASLGCGLLLLLSGWQLLRGDLSGMSTLASSLLVVLGVSSGSAWMLLVQVGKMKAELWPRGGDPPREKARR